MIYRAILYLKSGALGEIRTLGLCLRRIANVFPIIMIAVRAYEHYNFGSMGVSHLGPSMKKYMSVRISNEFIAIELVCRR